MYTHWTGSSVGIATDYGLEVPGSNLGVDEIYTHTHTHIYIYIYIR